MKRIIMLFILIPFGIIAYMIGCTTNPHQNHEVSFFNGTGMPAESLFIRKSGTNDWGADLISNSNSKNNYYLTSTSVRADIHQIDYLMHDIEGNRYVKQNVYVPSSISVEITDSEIEGYESFDPEFLRDSTQFDIFVGVEGNGILIESFNNLEYSELVLKIDGNEVSLTPAGFSGLRGNWDFVVGKKHLIEISVKEPDMNEVMFFTPVQTIVADYTTSSDYGIEFKWNMYPDDSVNSDVLGIVLRDEWERPHWQWSAPLSLDRRKFVIPVDLVQFSWQNSMVMELISQTYAISGRTIIRGYTAVGFLYPDENESISVTEYQITDKTNNHTLEEQ